MSTVTHQSRLDPLMQRLQAHKDRHDADPGHAHRAAMMYALRLAVAAADTRERREQAAEITGFPGVDDLMRSYYEDTALHDRRGIPLLDREADRVLFAAWGRPRLRDSREATGGLDL